MPLLRSSPDSLLFSIEDENDIAPMQSRVKRFAGEVGLPTEGAWSMAIAVSEAATNILKYAGEGTISLHVSEDAPRRLIFEALDEGDGVSNIEHALQDRVSRGVDLSQAQDRPMERSGLGLGLGAIQRMMDGMTIENREQGGLRVLAYRLIP